MNEYFELSNILNILKKDMLMNSVIPNILNGTLVAANFNMKMFLGKPEDFVEIMFRSSNIVKASSTKSRRDDMNVHEFGSAIYDLLVGPVSGNGYNTIQQILAGTPVVNLERYDMGVKNSNDGITRLTDKITLQNVMTKDFGEFSASVSSSYYWLIIESSTMLTTRIADKGNVTFNYKMPLAT
jgi:hypothetical protein